MSQTILALETATEACSVALQYQGEIIERYEVAPRQHSRLLLPMIDEVLAQAGVERSAVDVIAFGRGPGAFTGLRIAAGVAQGLAYALERPVAPVSTLAATALPYARKHPEATIVVANDARMNEVYSASYRCSSAGELLTVADEQVIAPERLAVVDGPWLGVGSGWAEYAQRLAVDWPAPLAKAVAEALPHAAAVAELAGTVEAVSPEEALPVYLRDRVTYAV